jgi:hypothetical protein
MRLGTRQAATCNWISHVSLATSFIPQCLRASPPIQTAHLASFCSVLPIPLHQRVMPMGTWRIEFAGLLSLSSS